MTAKATRARGGARDRHLGEEAAMARQAVKATEPSVRFDQLIDFIAARNFDDSGAASIAAEARLATKEFLEETGLNSQALSWGRVILKKLHKDNGEAKALDVLRSLDLILPMIRAHVEGQGTVDMFDAQPIALIEGDMALPFTGVEV
jgi:hypothetical protein